ncbi:MAG: SUMF1/EgtB/PvdO family nonheme iron enzyme [Coleofasciculus sp. C1-SOL-03]|uniref:SUMF1/EgtB/PvdO family nonheme iron enzyme n=1 Tax=Coleofasciculus sp. C1-SOL-03 TaxID=3069522 RepID=UPI0032F17A24
MPSAVVLTALPVEYLAVRTHLTDLQEEMHPQGTIYERGIFIANGHEWEVGIVEVGAGNAGAAVEAERAIAYFQPNILFFVGIAGGIKDVEIGHVVVATDIYGYESGKVGEQFFTRPKAEKSAYALVQRARAEARKGEWLQRLTNSPSPQPCVRVAPIAAGEKVIASRQSDIFQFLRASYNDAIAVEMEGFGFLSAAFAYPDIQAIVIRGISDLIEGKNDDAIEPEQVRQEKASLHASAFAFEVLAKLQIKETDKPSSPQSTTPLRLHESPQTRNSEPKLDSTFNFNVVTVNCQGKIINQQKRKANFFTEKLGRNIKLNMVFIRGEQFMMGSSNFEIEQNKNEIPQHEVIIQPFFMSKHPIIQAQWRAVALLPQIDCSLNPDPSHFKGDNRPVENINWYEIKEFCHRLSKTTGHEYRLPSEAEWEYACRAGTITPFYFGETLTTELANYSDIRLYDEDTIKGKYVGKTTNVMTFPPNAFGLYDMHGNVREWCSDHWHDNYQEAPSDGSSWATGGNNRFRILRGGSFSLKMEDCRSANRHKDVPSQKSSSSGFRIVCSSIQ